MTLHDDEALRNVPANNRCDFLIAEPLFGKMVVRRCRNGRTPGNPHFCPVHVSVKDIRGTRAGGNPHVRENVLRENRHRRRLTAIQGGE